MKDASGNTIWTRPGISSGLDSSDLASTAAGKGASLVGYLSGTVQSFLDSLLGDLGATLVKYKASFTGAVQRTLGAVAEDQVNSEWFAPDRTGATDASARLQMAFDAAAGRELTIRPGTYLLGTALQVSSHTTVIAYGCTFYRIGTIDNMIRNKADGVTGGYSANTNIRIHGGTWDSVNGPGTPSGNCTVMGFGHCDRVFLDGVYINNENQWHHVEFNGSTRCTVRDAYINGGYVTGYINSEAIQIDSAENSSQFPWFGPYDGTVCTHIRVLNSDFANVSSGIGSHSPTTTGNHNNIVIDGNHFFNVYFACIKPFDWSDMKITNNKGESCYSGIVATPQSRDASDVSILGNSFFHIGYGTYAGADGRGIRLNIIGAAKYLNVRLANNDVSDVLGANGTHGITADGCWRLTATGNTVRDCNRSGLFLYGGQQITVMGNAASGGGTASSSYEDIRLGTGTLADSTRFNVEGNVCFTLGTHALQNSMVRNNNIITSATHTGNSGTNVSDNLVGTTFTAG